MKVQLDTPDHDHDISICGNPLTCNYCNQLFRSGPRIMLERWVKDVAKSMTSSEVHSLHVRIPESGVGTKPRGLSLIEELVGRFFNFIPYIYSPYIDELKGLIQFDFEKSDHEGQVDLTVSIYMVGDLPEDILTWAGHISNELSDGGVQYNFVNWGTFRDEHDLFAMMFPMFPSRDTLELIYRERPCVIDNSLEDKVLLLHNCLPIEMLSLVGVDPTITHFEDLRNDVLKPLVIETYEYQVGGKEVPECSLFSGEWRDIIHEMSTWDHVGMKKG